MNNIYSKVWNRSLGRIVVTSELASNHKGNVRSTDGPKTAPCLRFKYSVAAILLLLGLVSSSDGLAQYAAGGGGGTASGSQSIAIAGNLGSSAVSSGTASIAVGKQYVWFMTTTAKECGFADQHALKKRAKIECEASSFFRVTRK